MKLLVDMNLAPRWCTELGRHGIESTHWSAIGHPAAPDRELLDHAREHGMIILTHDLDFGAILAAGGMDAPSVIQMRIENVLPEHAAPFVLIVLRDHAAELETGALAIIDETKARVRLLPLRQR